TKDKVEAVIVGPCGGPELRGGTAEGTGIVVGTTVATRRASPTDVVRRGRGSSSTLGVPERPLPRFERGPAGPQAPTLLRRVGPQQVGQSDLRRSVDHTEARNALPRPSFPASQRSDPRNPGLEPANPRRGWYEAPSDG